LDASAYRPAPNSVVINPSGKETTSDKETIGGPLKPFFGFLA
jgi:hypothetical protein